MSDVFQFKAENLLSLSALEISPEMVQLSIRNALNKAAHRGRVLAAEEIRKEVNFKSGYLDPSQGRLYVDPARPGFRDNLTAVLNGKDRPTSLARFIVGGTDQRNAQGRTPGFSVNVKTGKTVNAGRAFLIHLKNGNKGLAIRLKPGETINSRNIMVDVKGRFNGLHLLYGPSVNQILGQILRSEKELIQPEVMATFEEEFSRLIELRKNK